VAHDLEVIGAAVLLVENMKVLAGESNTTETVIAFGAVSALNQVGGAGARVTLNTVGQMVTGGALPTVGHVRAIRAFAAIGTAIATVTVLAEYTIGAPGTRLHIVAVVVHRIGLKRVFEFL
jgi:hypothetical protein